MMNADMNPSSNTSKEAPVHSKDTVLMCNDWVGRDKDEMDSTSVKMKNVAGGYKVLADHKMRL